MENQYAGGSLRRRQADADKVRTRTADIDRLKEIKIELHCVRIRVERYLADIEAQEAAVKAQEAALA